MMDFIKKLVKKIGVVLFLLVVGAIVIFSLLLGLGRTAEIVINFVKIAGGGSVFRGVITIPFFIFGVVQIFRGLCAIIQADVDKMNASDESLWHYLYIPATIAGCIAVILVICFWCTAA